MVWGNPGKWYPFVQLVLDFNYNRMPNIPIEFAPLFRFAGLLSHSRILASWLSRRRRISPFRIQDIWSCMQLFAEWAICRVLLHIWIGTTVNKTRGVSWHMMDLQLSIWPRVCIPSLVHSKPLEIIHRHLAKFSWISRFSWYSESWLKLEGIKASIKTAGLEGRWRVWVHSVLVWRVIIPSWRW